jgi:hypothetical protein
MFDYTEDDKTPATIQIALKERKWGYSGNRKAFEDKEGDKFICSEKLREVFDVPKKVKKLWVTVARSRRTGFSTFERVNGYDVVIDGKPVEIFDNANHLLDYMQIDDEGGKFFVMIEYKA